MPAKYRIDKSLGVVFTTVRGVLTGQDVLTHGQRLLDDPDFDPSYDHLIDLRDVIEIGISPHEMESITIHKHIFSQKSRRAIVAETDFKFAMSRMYEILSNIESGPIEVFRDMAEARRWLGLNQAPNSN